MSNKLAAIQSTQVSSPVPIKLKLLDKGWSGPDLCERLHNQLAGDYLRQEGTDCGVILFIWQGKQESIYWVIEGVRRIISGSRRRF